MKKFLPAVALVALVVLVIACMKEPNLVPDFGPEVTSDSFSKLVKPEPPSFNTVKANEYSYATRETWVEGRPFAINGRWALTVTSRVEQPDRYVIGLTHEQREYVQGEEKTSTRKADIAVSKQISAPSADSVMATHYPTRESAQRALADTSPQHPSAKSSLVSMSPISLFARSGLRALEAPVRRTMHNLSFTKGTFPVPEFVKQRANCGGLPQNICQGGIKAYYLTYDQVEWNETGGQKFSMSRVFSPDIPFFASIDVPLVFTDESRYFYPGVLRACINTDLPYNGVTIQLSQCDEIKDFTFGQP